MKKAVEVAKDRYEKLRRRNNLELEGYQNEVNLLRQRLTCLHKVFAASTATDENLRSVVNTSNIVNHKQILLDDIEKSILERSIASNH